jgi:hypothetical protein
MYAGNTAFDAVNVQATLGQLDLLPLQVADLRGPETVAIGDQDHGRIAMTVTAVLASAIHQALDLALGEIASLDCQVYDTWCAFFGPRFHRNKAPFFDADWLAYTRFLHSQIQRGCGSWSAARPTGSARATLPETCCAGDGRPSNDRQRHRPNAGFFNVVKLISEGVCAGTVQSHLKGASNEPARGRSNDEWSPAHQQFVRARSTPR